MRPSRAHRRRVTARLPAPAPLRMRGLHTPAPWASSGDSCPRTTGPARPHPRAASGRARGARGRDALRKRRPGRRPEEQSSATRRRGAAPLAPPVRGRFSAHRGRRSIPVPRRARRGCGWPTGAHVGPVRLARLRARLPATDRRLRAEGRGDEFAPGHPLRLPQVAAEAPHEWGKRRRAHRALPIARAPRRACRTVRDHRDDRRSRACGSTARPILDHNRVGSTSGDPAASRTAGAHRSLGSTPQATKTCNVSRQRFRGDLRSIV